jgi:hypothetical protein
MKSHQLIRSRRLYLAAAALLVSAHALHAQIDTWTGFDGNFSDDNNWDPYSPMTGDIALIQNNDGISRKITYDENGADLSGLTIDLSGGSSSDADTFNMYSNMLEVDGPTIVGQVGNGIFNQSGGATVISAAGADPNLYLGQQSGSSGAFNLSSNAALTIGGSAYIGGDSSSAQGNGTFTVSGTATLDIFHTLQIYNTSGTSVSLQGGNTSAANTVNQATITQTGGTANLGAVSGSGTTSIGNSSGTTATMTVSSIAQNSVTINPTGTLIVSPNSTSPNTVNTLTVLTGGTLDIGNNHLLVNYGASPSPKSSIIKALAAGFNSGHWNGPGIGSSTAAANNHYAVGYVDGADHISPTLTSGQLEIAYTLYGDINLDGVVNGNDFAILASHFGHTVTGGWEQGDLNYDGTVNGNDFALLAGNFGKTATGTAVTLPASQWAALDSFAAAHGLQSDVPEPTTATLAIATTLALFARKRRQTKTIS